MAMATTRFSGRAFSASEMPLIVHCVAARLVEAQRSGDGRSVESRVVALAVPRSGESVVPVVAAQIGFVVGSGGSSVTPAVAMALCASV